MKQTELLEQLKVATAAVPPGARARVWRRLQRPPAAAHLGQRSWAFAFTLAAACALVGVVAWLAARPAPAPVAVVAERYVLVKLPGAQVTPREAALQVSGGVVASVWGEPLELRAAGRAVRAEGAVFALQVVGESVDLDVREGLVEVAGERVEGGQRWPATSAFRGDFKVLSGLEPAHAAEERAWVLAEDALAHGSLERAVERFGELGADDGLRAEAALLRKGQLELWNLRQPARALSTLTQAEARFPSGNLRQEAALSAIEASTQLEDWSLARTRSRDFLAAFPDSERKAEVRLIGALGALRLGELAAACAELKALAGSTLGPRYQPALQELAVGCEHR